MRRPTVTPVRAALLVGSLVLLGTVAASLGRQDGAAAATAVSVGFGGDTGGNAKTAAVVDAARTSGVSAYFNLGDFSYSEISPESAWCSFISQHAGSGMAYELVTGNHEDDGPDGLWSNFAQCLPDKLGAGASYPRQYFVDYPAGQPLVRFIMVSPSLTFPEGSSYWSYKVGTQGYNFTASAIDGARSAGIPFVVVGMHKYCISMVDTVCQSRTDLMNLLVAKKVDLYLQAHDHGYERSKQLALAGSCTAIVVNSFNPDCVASADPSSSYVAGQGTVIATVGTAGVGIGKENSSNAQAPYFQTWMGSNSNLTYGFLKVDVTDTTLTGTFVGGTGGTYTDKFTITRSGATPTGTASPTPTDTASPTPTDTTSPTPTDTSSPTGTPSTTTFTPVADGWTGSDAPTQTHGSDQSLYMDASPVKATYLKFDLSGLAGKTVTSAQLQVTTTPVVDSGSDGPDTVRSVADTGWSESTLSYSNEPALGSVLATLGKTTYSTTYQLTLPVSAVQAGIGGLYSLGIDSTCTNAAYFGSRESATPPKLIVTTN